MDFFTRKSQLKPPMITWMRGEDNMCSSLQKIIIYRYFYIPVQNLYHKITISLGVSKCMLPTKTQASVGIILATIEFQYQVLYQTFQQQSFFPRQRSPSHHHHHHHNLYLNTGNNHQYIRTITIYKFIN